jgi:hypothetical protein
VFKLRYAVNGANVDRFSGAAPLLAGLLKICNERLNKLKRVVVLKSEVSGTFKG